jgi:hypothetical protein
MTVVRNFWRTLMTSNPRWDRPDLDAIQAALLDVLQDDVLSAGRKAEIQRLVEGIRVDSRKAIFPTFSRAHSGSGSDCEPGGGRARIRTWDRGVMSPLL